MRRGAVAASEAMRTEDTPIDGRRNGRVSNVRRGGGLPGRAPRSTALRERCRSPRAVCVSGARSADRARRRATQSPEGAGAGENVTAGRATLITRAAMTPRPLLAAALAAALLVVAPAAGALPAPPAPARTAAAPAAIPELPFDRFALPNGLTVIL